jgi:hypothetical protein
MNYAVEWYVVVEIEAASTDHAIRLAKSKLEEDGYTNIDFKALYSRKAEKTSEDK